MGKSTKLPGEKVSYDGGKGWLRCILRRQGTCGRSRAGYPIPCKFLTSVAGKTPCTGCQMAGEPANVLGKEVAGRHSWSAGPKPQNAEASTRESPTAAVVGILQHRNSNRQLCSGKQDRETREREQEQAGGVERKPQGWRGRKGAREEEQQRQEPTRTRIRRRCSHHPCRRLLLGCGKGACHCLGLVWRSLGSGLRHGVTARDTHTQRERRVSWR